MVIGEGQVTVNIVKMNIVKVNIVKQKTVYFKNYDIDLRGIFLYI